MILKRGYDVWVIVGAHASGEIGNLERYWKMTVLDKDIFCKNHDNQMVRNHGRLEVIVSFIGGNVKLGNFRFVATLSLFEIHAG